MDFIKRKIPGSSLLESLVAMAIILLTIGLSAGVHSGIAGNKKGLKTVFFQSECERIFTEMVNTKPGEYTENKNISSESYTYEIKTKPYNGSKELNELKIVVYEKGDPTEKKLFIYKRIIPSTENETAF